MHGTTSAAHRTPPTPHRIALTSPPSKEDEEILKAEYLLNAKPDKAARLEIVRKVALGEKEVQVHPPISLHVTMARARPNSPRSGSRTRDKTTADGLVP